MNLMHRAARLDDLVTIVALLADDKLGQVREQSSNELDKAYIDAFAKIDEDPNQYLMVLERDKQIIATCHLTLMPSLTFTGSTRMQIEAVRVHRGARGQKVGRAMIDLAINWGKEHGAQIFQLTTNKARPEAVQFYEKNGFKATHEGMKLHLAT